jgi:hypothetical protein
MRRPTRAPYARPAIQTLERLHAELGGKILENRQQGQNLAEQMRHVEAVIKMLDPGYSLRSISAKRRKPNPWFKRGTVYRRAVDALRTAEQPLTARDIAERVLAGVGDGQYKEARQGRAGGPDRDHQFVLAESRWQRRSTIQ